MLHAICEHLKIHLFVCAAEKSGRGFSATFTVMTSTHETNSGKKKQKIFLLFSFRTVQLNEHAGENQILSLKNVLKYNFLITVNAFCFKILTQLK